MIEELTYADFVKIYLLHFRRRHFSKLALELLMWAIDNVEAFLTVGIMSGCGLRDASVRTVGVRTSRPTWRLLSRRAPRRDSLRDLLPTCTEVDHHLVTTAVRRLAVPLQRLNARCHEGVVERSDPLVATLTSSLNLSSPSHFSMSLVYACQPEWRHIRAAWTQVTHHSS